METSTLIVALITGVPSCLAGLLGMGVAFYTFRASEPGRATPILLFALLWLSHPWFLVYGIETAWLLYVLSGFSVLVSLGLMTLCFAILGSMSG